MAKVTPINEHFQHFLDEMKETFWGDLYGQTRQAWQRFFQLESERQRDRFTGWGWHERRAGKRRRYRDGYSERDFVTCFGTIRLRIARTRRPTGRKRVHMLVAYGVRRDGTRQLLAFVHSQGESQAEWEGLLQEAGSVCISRDHPIRDGNGTLKLVAPSI
jgi:Transposase, Mutator family